MRSFGARWRLTFRDVQLTTAIIIIIFFFFFNSSSSRGGGRRQMATKITFFFLTCCQIKSVKILAAAAFFNANYSTLYKYMQS